MRTRSRLISLMAATFCANCATSAVVPPSYRPEALSVDAKMTCPDALAGYSPQAKLRAAQCKEVELDRDRNKAHDEIERARSVFETLRKSNAARYTTMSPPDRTTTGRAAKEIVHDINSATTGMRLGALMAGVEASMSYATSVWQDDDLRDGYDKFRGTMTTLATILNGCAGAVAIATPLLLDANRPIGDSHNKTVLIVGGLITGGLTVLGAGGLIAPVVNESGKAQERAVELRNKLQFIDLSRRAFGDLSVRRKTLEDVDARLKASGDAFSALDKTISAALDKDVKAEQITEVREAVRQYREIYALLPTYFDQMRQTMNNYLATPSLPAPPDASGKVPWVMPASIHSALEATRASLDKVEAFYKGDFTNVHHFLTPEHLALIGM